jgi:hypothetical protein
MKYLLRVLFVVALLCGGSGFAHADGVDFRMTVLDPPNMCADPSLCFIGDPGTQFNVGLSADACPPGVSAGLTPGTFGCFVGDNLTGATITSLMLTFDAPIEGQTASCDNGGQGNLQSALNVVSCGLNQDGTKFLLNFAGGAGVAPLGDIIVFEEGADPADFTGGTGVVGITPEPDSLLLFSTGVMMAGLYMSRRIWTAAGKSANGNR